MKQRVWITGVGIVSPLGATAAETHCGMVDGRRAIRLRPFDTARRVRLRGGATPSLGAVEVLANPKMRKLMAPDARYAVAAASEALRTADIEPRRFQQGTGLPLYLAVGLDSLTWTAQIEGIAAVSRSHGARRLTAPFYFECIRDVNPLDAIRLGTNMVAAHVSIQLGLVSAPFLLGGLSVHSATVLGLAMRAIQSGACDIALVGGADDPCNLGTLHFLRGKGIRVPRFAREDWVHNALVPGPGAGFLVLESARRAQRRQRRPIAELLGFGSAFGVSARDGSGYDEAMRAAMEEAGVGPSEVSHVHLDGLAGRGGAPDGGALDRLFHAAGARPVPFSARCAIGHLGAAAPPCEVGIAAVGLRAGHIPALRAGALRRLAPDWMRRSAGRRRRPRCALLGHAAIGGPTTAIVLGAPS